MKWTLVLVAAIGLVGPARAQEIDTGPAMTVAQEWLALMDAGRYFDSWEALTPSFQQSVPKVRWDNQMQTVRGPLGVVNSRKVRSATYGRTQPGVVPEGEYVVIQFDTRFENRPLTIETVTPLREPGGAWKVSGYNIR